MKRHKSSVMDLLERVKRDENETETKVTILRGFDDGRGGLAADLHGVLVVVDLEGELGLLPLLLGEVGGAFQKVGVGGVRHDELEEAV